MARNMDTVPGVLHHWATHEPDTAAFVFKDSALRRRVLTRANVYRLAARFAAILRRDGIRRGDIVCNTLPNSPERVVSDFGVMVAGATVMNGQIFLADGADFIGSLRDAEAKAVVLDPLQPKGAMSFLKSLEPEEMSDGTVRIQKLPALRRIIRCHWEEGQGQPRSFIDKLEQHEESYVADVTAEDNAYIWTSSGSTGFSKLIPHSHSSYLSFSRRFSESCGLGSCREYHENVATETGVAETEQFITHISSQAHGSRGDAISNPQDAHKESRDTKTLTREEIPTRYARHVFFDNSSLGWSGGCPACFLTVGATRVLVDLSRCPPNDLVAFIWTMICEEKCKFSFMLPFLAQQILSQEDLWSNRLWSLSVLTLAGQPVHATLVRSAMANIADVVHVFYGSSEVGPATCKQVLDARRYEDCNNGKVLPGLEVKVVDQEANPVTRGKLGEVIVLTETKVQNYISNEEASQKAALPGGWFRTGDVGYFNDEEELFVVCRTSFVIMRGAYLLHPGWLEARISTHPAVESVMLVPVPDPVLHQELCCCVVTKAGTSLTVQELKEFCQSLFLTGSGDHMTAVPPYFLFFSALPATVTGKPCRHSTTREARERLGL